MVDGFARCSFTLPPDQAQMLSHVAKRVGASQSAVLSILLQETLPWLSTGLPEDADPALGARRLRGASVEAVRGLIQSGLSAGRKVGVSGTQGLAVSRNALCPCGSGKKFKRCCGL
jgi:hypothetical protein